MMTVEVVKDRKKMDTKKCEGKFLERK